MGIPRISSIEVYKYRNRAEIESNAFHNQKLLRTIDYNDSRFPNKPHSPHFTDSAAVSAGRHLKGQNQEKISLSLMKRKRVDSVPENRIVAHIDLDCFYVQVERSINPSLKGKAVGVAQCQ